MTTSDATPFGSTPMTWAPPDSWKKAVQTMPSHASMLIGYAFEKSPACEDSTVVCVPLLSSMITTPSGFQPWPLVAPMKSTFPSVQSSYTSGVPVDVQYVDHVPVVGS